MADRSRRNPPDIYLVGVEENEEEEGEYDDDYDEAEEEEEDYDNEHDDDVAKTGLACPFCFEDFDVLGLCCHIDIAHHREAKAGVCPICVKKVDVNIVAHLFTQHETILKMLCKKKIHKGLSHSALLMLKKESQDERLQSCLKESSSVDSSSSMERDSLLLSFVHNPQPLQKPESVRPSTEASSLRSNSDDDTLERDNKTCALPSKDQEKIQRCEFVHHIVFSTIFVDDL